MNHHHQNNEQHGSSISSTSTSSTSNNETTTSTEQRNNSTNSNNNKSLRRAKRHVRRPVVVSHDSWVNLNVGGRIFSTTRGTLTAAGDNMLAHMFGKDWQVIINLKILSFVFYF